MFSETVYYRVQSENAPAFPSVESLTPKQIVAELDRYIIGQSKAKRAVAIALRNRYRRSLLPEELREEVIPKNILMIGPTGVGKTEIARRLAKLAHAPFLKVEATKFTEVGYVGRDVDSIVRDLMQVSIRLVEDERIAAVQEEADKAALDQIVEILEPTPVSASNKDDEEEAGDEESEEEETGDDDEDAPPAKVPKEEAAKMENFLKTMFGPSVRSISVREVKRVSFGETTEPRKSDPEPDQETLARRQTLREQILSGVKDNDEIEIEQEENQSMGAGGAMGGAFPIGVIGIRPVGGDNNDNGSDSPGLGDLFQHLANSRRKRKRRVPIREARRLLRDAAARNLLDKDAVIRDAITRAEESGIVFLDEVDKIAGRGNGGSGSPDVSREGVQRDLLPLIEGSTVQTKYGPVRTHFVLFIAAGAFHVSKPSDLIPELQGRLPIRGRTRHVKRGRLPAYPDRAKSRADQAVRRASRDRWRFYYDHGGCRARTRPRRGGGERTHRKYRG